jgi:hypothetical protein
MIAMPSSTLFTEGGTMVLGPTMVSEVREG